MTVLWVTPLLPTQTTRWQGCGSFRELLEDVEGGFESATWIIMSVAINHKIETKNRTGTGFATRFELWYYKADNDTTDHYTITVASTLIWAKKLTYHLSANTLYPNIPEVLNWLGNTYSIKVNKKTCEVWILGIFPFSQLRYPLRQNNYDYGLHRNCLSEKHEAVLTRAVTSVKPLLHPKTENKWLGCNFALTFFSANTWFFCLKETAISVMMSSIPSCFDCFTVPGWNTAGS